jgi:hypothetical protein
MVLKLVLIPYPSSFMGWGRFVILLPQYMKIEAEYGKEVLEKRIVMIRATSHVGT